MIELNIKTPSQFSMEIESIVKEKKISYLDAVLHYVETNNVEIESAASLIKSSQILKSKLMVDAEELNLVKKTAKLPI